MAKIKVLSYNLFYGKALSHLKNLIKKEAPDVVGLQEIEEKKDINREFSNLKYNVAISSHSFKKFGKIFNITTLYKTNSVKLSYFNYFNLPRSIYEKLLYFLKKSPLPRSFTVTYFLKNSKQFLHINIHISPWSADGEKIRQIKQVLNFVSSTTLPVVITGDFNYPYGKKRLEYLLQQYEINEATKNLKFTQESKILRIIPIRMKLDYIFYKKMKLIKTLRLEKNTSDHYPILSEFEL